MADSTGMDKIHDLLLDFDTAMLATVDKTTGMIHARPMQVVKVDDNCDVWFISGHDSMKVHEIEQDAHVLLTFQSDKDRFLSVSGQAGIIEDQGKVNELWQDSFHVWFPDGKTDPNICLIRIRTDRAEFWDNEGMNKAKYWFETTKARLTQTAPQVAASQHSTVTR